MKTRSASVNPLHFDDFDGRDFERLVLAYMLRSDSWHTIEWYSQQGSASGRDIWRVRDKRCTC